MLESFEFWYWWVLAALMIVAELLLSGAFFFLWLAGAAILTGILVLVVPGLALEYQLLVFAVLAVLSVFLWRRFRPMGNAPTDHPSLNRRGSQYVGQQFTLDKPIVNGIGKLTVADTTWKIRGDDMPAGAVVKVVAVDGTALRVERTGAAATG